VIEKGLVRIWYEELNSEAEKPIHMSLRGKPRDFVLGLTRIISHIALKSGFTPESLIEAIRKTYEANKAFFEKEVGE